jgi:hypothetical protein
VAFGFVLSGAVVTVRSHAAIGDQLRPVVRERRVGALHFWQQHGRNAMTTFWLRRTCACWALVALLPVRSLSCLIRFAKVQRRRHLRRYQPRQPLRRIRAPQFGVVA